MTVLKKQYFVRLSPLLITSKSNHWTSLLSKCRFHIFALMCEIERFMLKTAFPIRTALYVQHIAWTHSSLYNIWNIEQFYKSLVQQEVISGQLSEDDEK